MFEKVLVTGGAGYIGSIFVPELLAAGYDVTVVDNFMYGQHSLGQLCNNPRFHVARGDVRVEETMKPLIAQADIIVPLAALVGAPLCKADPVNATTTNRDAVVMMLKHVGKNQLIVMPTTNNSYGSGDENNYCNEESPLLPVSQYAREKVEVEQRLMEHENSISFRLATVFGMSPRMRLDLLVNDFTWRAHKDKFIVLFESHFKRNFIHVRDVARAFMHGITNADTMRGQIYNIGISDTNITKKELCERIKQQVQQFVFLEADIDKDPDQRNYIVSNAKVEATGYKPQYTLDMGIHELLNGYPMLHNTVHGNI